MKNFFNFGKNILNSISTRNNVSTQPAFFIKTNYKHRIKSVYFNTEKKEGNNVTYQPDVYPISGLIAKKLGCTYIIDVGCGSGQKLVPLAKNFKIIGIDYGDNITKCKKEYNFGTWISWDFEKMEYLDIAKDVLKSSVIICADVVEHLLDPSNLLKNIKKFLEYSPMCLLSTPERDLVRGPNDFGPPVNPHHVREWNMAELMKLLTSNGFSIAFNGLTASSDKDYKQDTILAALQNSSINGFKELEFLKRKHTTILSQ